jgi:hypothetical protein
VLLVCAQVVVPSDPLTAWFLTPAEREALHQLVGLMLAVAECIAVGLYSVLCTSYTASSWLNNSSSWLNKEQCGCSLRCDS